MTREQNAERDSRMVGRWRRPAEIARKERLDKVAAAMRDANRGKVQGRRWARGLEEIRP